METETTSFKHAHPVNSHNERNLMKFGEAIEALKSGSAVRRAGWNGKGMHIYLEEDLRFFPRTKTTRGFDRVYEPCVCLFTAQSKHQPGWVPSQADMLSDDWEIVVLGS
jgi:hypothetical protein